MKFFISFSFFSAIFFLWACNQNSDQLFKDITGRQNGIFRSAQINDSPADLKLKEDPSALIEQDEYMLIYQYDFQQAQTKIEYAFDDKGLYKIEALTDCRKDKTGKELWEKLRKYYSETYGSSDTAQNSHLWLTRDSEAIIELRRLNNNTSKLLLTVEALE